MLAHGVAPGSGRGGMSSGRVDEMANARPNAFLLSLVINAVALLIPAWVVTGIHLGAAGPHPNASDWVTLFIVALIFGLVNAVIRPILILLSLPLEILPGSVHLRDQRVHAASNELDCTGPGPWVPRR